MKDRENIKDGDTVWVNVRGCISSFNHQVNFSIFKPAEDKDKYQLSYCGPATIFFDMKHPKFFSKVENHSQTSIRTLAEYDIFHDEVPLKNDKVWIITYKHKKDHEKDSIMMYTEEPVYLVFPIKVKVFFGMGEDEFYLDDISVTTMADVVEKV